MTGIQQPAPSDEVDRVSSRCFGRDRVSARVEPGAQPIVSDPTIAQAWGQALFWHYPQVSRTLEAAAWVKDLLFQANQNFQTALDQVKTLVQIVSRAGLAGSAIRWGTP